MAKMKSGELPAQEVSRDSRSKPGLCLGYHFHLGLTLTQSHGPLFNLPQGWK